MATLKESIEIAAKNPNSSFAKELKTRIESGQYNETAKREGINLGNTKQPVKSGNTGLGGFVTGIAKEAGQRVASVQQNVGKVVSGLTEKAIGTKPDESASELASINATLLRKARELPQGDPKRKALEDAIQNNTKALGIYNEEIKSRTQKESMVSERPSILTPKTSAEKVGAGVEQVAEFFIPSGLGEKALQATKLGQGLSKAQDLNLLGKTTRTLIKGIGEGADFAIKSVAQKSTEDLSTQLKTGAGSFLLGLAMTPVISVAGSVIKTGLDKITKRLPERLMSVIFKTSADDLKAEWNSIAKGKTINKTLAREALENDIFGSSEKMGVYSIKKLADIEKMVKQTSKVSSKIINVGKPQTKKTIEFLRDIAVSYNGPFSEVGPTAKQLATEIAKGKGNMNPNLVLRLKRFFDALRVNSSFNTNPTLSLKQEGLKNAANVFRQELYNAGFKTAMEQERIFIEALEALVKDAATRRNKNVIGLVDLLAGGGGMVSGGPFAGVGAAAAIRGIQQPPIITGTARALFKGGQAIEKSSVTNSIKSIAQPSSQLMSREALKQEANQ